MAIGVALVGMRPGGRRAAARTAGRSTAAARRCSPSAARAATRSRPRAPRAATPRSASPGPNFDNRHETKDQVLYAIRNGGFSGAIMPQNIVVGEDAQAVAEFVAKYAGKSAKGPPGLTPGGGRTRPARPASRAAPKSRRAGATLDLKLIRSDPDGVKAALARRGAADKIDELLELDARRRALLPEVEEPPGREEEGVGGHRPGQARRGGRRRGDRGVECARGGDQGPRAGAVGDRAPHRRAARGAPQPAGPDRSGRHDRGGRRGRAGRR